SERQQPRGPGGLLLRLPQEGAAGAHHHPLHRTDQHGPVRERVHRGQEPRGTLCGTLHQAGDGAGGPRPPLRPGAGPVRPCKPPGGRGGAGAGTRGHRGRHGLH
ncbi:Sel1 repeat, partial [Dysosmobacter welbionis]